MTSAIAIFLAGSANVGGIAIPPASAATGPDETGQYLGKQGCVDDTVYQPTQKLGFRLRAAFYVECQDPSVARPQLEASYSGARGAITITQGPAGSFGPGKWPTWEARSAAGSTQVGAVTGPVGHVDDPDQLMSPVHGSASTNRLQPGDIAGLAQLASLPCFA